MKDAVDRNVKPQVEMDQGKIVSVDTFVTGVFPCRNKSSVGIINNDCGSLIAVTVAPVSN